MLGLLNFTHFISTYGYGAIFLLSVLQSCCIPTSSEITLGFAGVLASEGKLNLAAVILVGTAGEILGAYIAWFIGRYAGRAAVDRYGRYVLVTHHDLDRAEGWYDRHGNWAVFGGRLLPVIRNFVALVAGVAEVPLVRFGLLTAAGSAIWLGAMAGIGYGVGGTYNHIMKGFSYAGYVLAVVVVAAVAFVIWHRYRGYKAATAGGQAAHRNGSRAPADRPTDSSAAGTTAGTGTGTTAGRPAGPAGEPGAGIVAEAEAAEPGT